MATDPELLTPRQVAAILRISPASVSRLSSKGVLRCVRISPRIVRYRQDDIDDLLRSGVPDDEPEAVAR